MDQYGINGLVTHDNWRFNQTIDEHIDLTMNQQSVF